MLRKATIDDCEEILQIITACVNPPWSRASLEYALLNANNDFLVYQADNRIVAYACFENVIDESCLSSIAVKSEFRRQGIAEQLIKTFMSSTAMKSVYLEVCEDNKSAIALYEKVGFAPVTVRKKYYGDLSAIIMRKEL